MNTNNFSVPADDSQQILSVSALNQTVSRMLERSFPLLWVAGEISNFTRAASGHWYFTLKDKDAQVRAVMFRGRAQYVDFIPKEGDRIEVRALVTLYAPRGDYQLNVEAVRRAGLGNLYEAFLQLKDKLNREGLFDPARKRPLPMFARTIGIVTSLQAAALRDVLIALRRRAPHVHIIIYPTPVHGEAAAEKISAAIQLASARAECDLLLVCRGGGSIEDLWSFNDEGVARAIVACVMPVIAGIGHETDFTLADFAADLRAPTPTAAAELATTPHAEWMATLTNLREDLKRRLRRRLDDSAQNLDWLTRRLISPSTLIRHERLKLQSWQTRLAHATRMPVARARHALTQANTRLTAHFPQTTSHRRQLFEQTRQLSHSIGSQQMQRRQALASLTAQLELLNPQRTLERGYAIVTDVRGNIVREPLHIHPRENLTLRLAKGVIEIAVASTQTSLDSGKLS